MHPLKKYLKDRNIDPEEFADFIGVKRNAVYRYMRSKNGKNIPSRKVMRRISEFTQNVLTEKDFEKGDLEEANYTDNYTPSITVYHNNHPV